MYRPFRFCGGLQPSSGQIRAIFVAMGMFAAGVLFPAVRLGCQFFTYVRFVFLLFYACVVLSPLSIAFLYPFRRLIVVLKSRHLPLEVRFAAITSAWFFCKRRFGRRGGCGSVSICLRPFALSAACRHKVIFPPFPVLRQFLSAFIICAFSALIPQALHTIERL